MPPVAQPAPYSIDCVIPAFGGSVDAEAPVTDVKDSAAAVGPTIFHPVRVDNRNIRFLIYLEARRVKT